MIQWFVYSFLRVDAHSKDEMSLDYLRSSSNY